MANEEKTSPETCRISVVMTTYNGEAFLREQLESLRMQTRQPDEIIISDDCSDDSTWEILSEYRKKHPEMPISLSCNSENLGYRRNYLQALCECTGDIVFLCDQDDFWYPEKIGTMVNLMSAHPQIKVLASSFTLIDAFGRIVRRHRRPGWSNQNLYHRRVRKDELVMVTPRELIYHNFCQGCAMCFRSEIKDIFISQFSDEVSHDWHINLIGAISGGTWFYNAPLMYYRIHSRNAKGLQIRTDRKGKLAETYRTAEAKDSLALIGAFERLTGDRLTHEADRRFLEKYLAAMQKKSSFSLARMNLQRNYSKLKSAKGRTGDLLYTLRRKNKPKK